MLTYRKVKTKTAEIELDWEGIMRLNILGDTEIDEVEAARCFAAYAELGCKEKKRLLLIDARTGFEISRDARTFTASRLNDFFIASAVITNSFATRLMINFFNSVYKHGIPVKIFSNEGDALRWLRKFQAIQVDSLLHCTSTRF